LTRALKKHVSECLIYLKKVQPKINTKNRVIETTAANDLWEMDLIGPIKNEDKNAYVFVAIDHHTKWLKTKVISDKSASTILSEIIVKHVRPKCILSDCGTEFIAL
ncbi:putative transposable element, partial [Pseudoloma neurophilia]